MAITFKFYADAALTSEIVAPIVASQDVDNTIPPIDHVLYLGSQVADRRVQAESAPGTDDIEVRVENVTGAWQPATAYGAGAVVRTTTQNGFKYQAQVAGDSAGTEPVWPLTVGQTVVDGTVTWENIGPIHETTEVRLALDSAGLAGAVPGAALAIGPEILSGAAGAVEVWARIDDATDVVGTETELRLTTNLLIETAVA